MGAEITTDDRAKHVIDGSGTEIGIVDDVDNGTAYVDPDPDIDDELKTKLGWGSDERSTYPLRNDAVDAITDDEIQLHDEY